MGGTADDVGYGIAKDSNGNIYTIGTFVGTADFDPGISIFNLTSAGATDIFISKLDSMGSFVWAKRIGSTGEDIGLDITLDATGNIYITGNFSGTVDFDPNATIFNLTSFGLISNFVLKLDPSGNFAWATRPSNAQTDYNRAIQLDISNNVYTTGKINDSIFLNKLDSNGNLVWNKTMTSTAGNVSFALALDASQNVYVTGGFSGTMDFDPNVGTVNLTSTGAYDIFICKFSPQGNLLWAKNMGGTAGVFALGSGIAIDAAQNIYTTGVFYQTVDFDPSGGSALLTSAGSGDIFISKLDADGNFVWAKSFGGIGEENSNRIVLDAGGNIYTTGSFNLTVDFNPNAGVYNLTNTGGPDAYVSKLNSSGDLVWATNFGSPQAGQDIVQGIDMVIDATGNVFTVGSTRNIVDFDPTAAIFNLTSAGGTDIFIQKLNDTLLSIDSNSTVSKFRIFPNPTSNNLNLSFNDNLENATLKIISILGQTVLEKQNLSGTEMSFDVDCLVKGVYIVQVSDGAAVINAKFVKE